LQTYTASIVNNELLEGQIRSDLMQIDLAQQEIPESWPPMTAFTLPQHHNGPYTAVKSPCRVDGKVFDIAQNTALFDFTDRGEPISLLTAIRISQPRPMHILTKLYL
jgi:hypothetical protein